MIQAIGLTSVHRRRLRPAVDDLTFEARPGRVTVLLGPKGAGKTTALQLMLQLRPGRGVALFRGRPVHRVQHLAREVGVLLGDVPGHPARTARGHMRMLSAVAGVGPERADEVLEVVGLSGLADQRLGLFSLGMDRRLGIAAALLGDPHTFVLDEPAQGLSPRERAWLYGLLRGYAAQGGTVLITSRDVKEATRLADRVVSIDDGRLVADQDVTDFARTRLRPRVAVHTPYAEKLAAVLVHESRRADADPATPTRRRAPLEVVREEGNRLSVYGSSCAEVGEYAYRHGILVHQLADEQGEIGDTLPAAELLRADGRPASEANVLAPAISSSPTSDPNRPPAASAFPDPADSDSCPTVPLPPVASATVQGPPQRAAALISSTGDDGADPTRTESTAEEQESAPPAPRAHPQGGSSSSPIVLSRAEADTTTGSRPRGDARSGTESGRAPLSVRAHEASPEHTVRVSVEADAIAGAESDTDPRLDKVPETSDEASPNSPSQPTWMPARPSPRAAPLPPPLPAVARPGPVAPLRYELHRLFGVRTTWLTLGAAALAGLVFAVVSTGTGNGLPRGTDRVLGSAARILAGWPESPVIFLSPAALAAGVLGALAFGQEFRYPALAPARTSVPRRLGLLAAKLVVSAALALALCLCTAGLNAAIVSLAFGPEVLSGGAGGADWQVQAAAVAGFTVGCAWIGVLAAGICRSTWAGTAVVLAVPLLIAPAVRALLTGPADRSVDGLPKRLEKVLLIPWPKGADHWLSIVLRLASQPVGRAVALCLCVLLCLYVGTSLRSRAR